VEHRFWRLIRSQSGRNGRYIRAIVETIDPAELPLPLRQLLNYVEPEDGRPRVDR
jgi:hypothetical protein